MDTVLEYHTINYDDNKDLMKELNIYSLPTIFIYKNNKILYSIKEYIEEDQLRNKINELIKDYN
ncbi:thioredoxin family protein [uncultured Lutibacter sp.]|uniref:thioredoxin family protein n=1 Tax=uncultured Lutibacter sp. TaxID=437739 RepID=UPI0026299D96|nr:thioredoxin family protein [uncultured Lutibacter sp.]